MSEIGNYKPNSNLSKNNTKPTDEKRVEKIVTGTVKTKPNSIRKLADTFVTGNTKDLKETIIMDIAVPTIKKMVSEVISTAVDVILYGGTGRNKRTTNVSGYTSYDRFSSRREDDRASTVNSARKMYSYDDVTIDNRGEAEMLLREMKNTINRYGMVRVADLYDFVGITGDPTDNKYGWTDLRNVEVVRVRNGYKLDLPRAMPID